MLDLSKLQNILGIKFNNPELLKQALVHSSYVHENPVVAPVSNERLEYLGDAVLGFVFADMLFSKFPQYQEGHLTRFRSLLVRRSTLCRLALRISLGEYLYLGKGEEVSHGRQKPANLAGALEALIAAVYLDQGLFASRDFVFFLFNEEINDLLNQISSDDYKSRLQELVQEKKQITPSYNILESAGPAHDKMFVAEVSIGDQVISRGSGSSKKKAEAAAARIALDLLKDTLQD